MAMHVLIAMISLASGAAGTAVINAVSKRNVTRAEGKRTDAEAESIIVVSANTLLAQQQLQIDRADVERVRLEGVVTGLRIEVDNLHAALREERTRCDGELHQIRQEFRAAILAQHPVAATSAVTTGPVTTTTVTTTGETN